MPHTPDYHLVCVLDRAIEECTPLRSERVLYLDPRGDALPVSLRHFNRIRYYAALQEARGGLSSDQRKRYRGICASLRKSLNPDAVERIVDGVGHGELLLNTYGGLYSTYRMLRSALRRLENAAAFVVDRANSGGAYSLSHTDVRFAQKNAMVIWHIPTCGGGREQYRLRLRTFFAEQATPGMRSEALRLLNEQLNKGHYRLEVMFTVEQLERLGIFEKTYARLGWLARSFERRMMGARVEDFPEGNAVRNFFERGEDREN